MHVRTLFLIVFCVTIVRVVAAPFGANLLVNGDAESGAASVNGEAVTIPGWGVTGAPTVVKYGTAGGFPTLDQGPSIFFPSNVQGYTGGKQFFAGGNNVAQSTLAQSIDVSGNAADIDAGKVICDVSGWLGGFADQGDQAQLIVFFKAANNGDLGNITIGPVTAANRNNATSLRFRTASAVLPANTRSLVAALVMSRVGALAFNDGYADNLSVVLRGPAVVTNTADSGPGSFRDALVKGTIITFDPVAFSPANGPQTITLQTVLPLFQGGETIIGPGANFLTIRRGDAGVDNFGIFFMPSLGGSPVPNITISGLTLANGNATINGATTNHGGAVCVFNFNLTMQNCVLTSNRSDYRGAISINDATVLLDGCTISGNTAQQLGAIGQDASGASLTTTISNCTISGNTSVDGTAAIENRAFNGSFAELDVISSTITGNTAAFRQSNFGGTVALVTLDNTIVANNGAAQFKNDGGQPVLFTSKGHNLSSNDDAAILKQTGDINNANPMLGPLQNNGGPTLTHALLPGSPAIDSGNSSRSVDQRGFPRPIDDPNTPNSGGGNNSDIGAYEFGSRLTALGNISTRLPVQTGDNVLIGGFIVTGAQPKKVMVRAIGPSLPFAGVLANPTLELYNGSTLLESNDNWVESPNKQAIIDSGLAPGNNLESAIIRTLTANGTGYTAIVRGANNTAGIGVVEAFDLDSIADSKLANISSRGFVQSGDNILIAGTIVLGSLPQKVLVRAIGPSLPLAGTLPDPTLELHDQNGVLLEANDNWVDSTNKQAIIDNGLAPSNNLESAIFRTLPANGAQYTAIVRGANNTTGIAVVEIYALD